MALFEEHLREKCFTCRLVFGPQRLRCCESTEREGRRYYHRVYNGGGTTLCAVQVSEVQWLEGQVRELAQFDRALKAPPSRPEWLGGWINNPQLALSASGEEELAAYVRALEGACPVDADIERRIKRVAELELVCDAIDELTPRLAAITKQRDDLLGALHREDCKCLCSVAHITSSPFRLGWDEYSHSLFGAVFTKKCTRVLCNRCAAIRAVEGADTPGRHETHEAEEKSK